MKTPCATKKLSSHEFGNKKLLIGNITGMLHNPEIGLSNLSMLTSAVLR